MTFENASNSTGQISTIFIRAMLRYRCLCCRRVSVCLSVTRRYCILTAKLILKLLTTWW